MVKLNTYTQSGVKSSMLFPKSLQEKHNRDLLAQAVRVYQDRTHPSLSKVKTRSEVDLTTAKVWRQKGTGRARHGARSAPIFVGGGVAHGPKGVKRTLKMSRKMAKKALLVALSMKAEAGQIVVVKNVSKIGKTKDAQKLIDTIVNKEGLNSKTKINLILSKDDVQTKKAFRNIGNIQILNRESLGLLDIHLSSFMIFEAQTFEDFTKAKTTFSKSTEGKKDVVEKNEKKAEGPKRKQKSPKTRLKKGSK